MSKPKVIVIGGPTASGKTGLSIEIAKKINGEIISADSMQIYKHMNIGTAKVTQEEMQGVNHYLIDIIEPNQRYSVAEFKKDAEEKIEEILSKGKVPIVVGGTGLYIDTLIYGIEYPEIEIDLKYRKQLEDDIEKHGLNYLYNKASEIDEEAMKKISVNDKKRIMRVLEIYHSTGKTKTQMEIESRKHEVKYDYRVFAIDMDRDILYNRINLRVDEMIKKGLIDEVKEIIKRYDEMPTAMQGLGYKEVLPYLDNKITLDEMSEKIKLESRRYAKRQLTWFRKNKNIIWLDGLKSKEDNVNIVLETIAL